MRFIALSMVLATACTPIEVRPDAGLFFTIEHGSARFQDAMEGARRHCAAMGMDARHLGTDRGEFMLSRFECVPK